jgi:Lrp/AsnC family transcriptional regulator, leucine-responsive regulatory protein
MKEITLDITDLKLLELLQTDASQSNQSLAEKVHISPPTCLRRVKILVESGLIERQMATASPPWLKSP